MHNLNKYIRENGSDFLLLEGRVPTLTLGFVKEELVLYNIVKTDYTVLLSDFKTITGKEINLDSLIYELSHGQRLILSALIALKSPAKKIKFHNFFTSLSANNRLIIRNLIQEKIIQGKIIEIVDDHGNDNR